MNEEKNVKDTFQELVEKTEILILTLSTAMVTRCILVHVQLRIITILFFLFTFVCSLSFNFTSFTPNDPNILYEKSAYPANGVIQLTTNQRDLSTLASVGRATYAQPLQLWNKSSGYLSNFTTRFTFVINSLNGSAYGDGIAFFLAPFGSRIPNNVTNGGSLGLTVDSEFLNDTANVFVAVEFDIYSNYWDPPKEHVGIDIDSMESVKNVSWWSAESVTGGRSNNAKITYDSSSKNLSVVFSGFRNRTYVRQKLSYLVDLRDRLPELVTFGFSAATGNASALHSIYAWSFSSTLEQSGNETDVGGVVTKDPIIVELDPGKRVPDSNESKNKNGLVVGLAFGGCASLGILGFLVYFFRKMRKGKTRDVGDTFNVSISDEFERGGNSKKFTYKDLIKATNNFAPQEKLGEGGFGGVYKGFLKGIDSFVAVKRVSSCSKQGIKEYASEVKIISQLRHRNLVKLRGWCHEENELLLVYEFMPNGSLDSHLFGGRSLLNRGIRCKIVQGLASALLYLHEEWEQCVVHRDIKSSNVMLDANFNVKLGDFGLARLVDHDRGFQTTILAGTVGYMAPECLITGKASKETDVYAFGVVILEIVSGRKSIEPKAGNGQVSLVEWAWSLYEAETILEAVDQKLKNGSNSSEEMEQLLIVGLWCAHPDSIQRPSIRQAVHMLSSEAPLPVLSRKVSDSEHKNRVSLFDGFSSSPYGTGEFTKACSSSASLCTEHKLFPQSLNC